MQTVGYFENFLMFRIDIVKRDGRQQIYTGKPGSEK